MGAIYDLLYYKLYRLNPLYFYSFEEYLINYWYGYLRMVFIELGFIFKAIKRFLAHLVPSGTPDVLIPLIVMIELVRNFIRPITLSVRLSANIVAGHLLIRLVNGGSLSLTTGPVIVLSGVVLIVLEVSVAFIQGYVFSTLRVIYFSELNSALGASKS